MYITIILFISVFFVNFLKWYNSHSFFLAFGSLKPKSDQLPFLEMVLFISLYMNTSEWYFGKYALDVSKVNNRKKNSHILQQNINLSKLRNLDKMWAQTYYLFSIPNVENGNINASSRFESQILSFEQDTEFTIICFVNNARALLLFT